MADLPIITTESDWEKHALPVQMTLTANEWIVVSSALEELASQPGIADLGPKLKALAAYFDTTVVTTLLEQRMEAHRGDVRG